MKQHNGIVLLTIKTVFSTLLFLFSRLEKGLIAIAALRVILTSNARFHIILAEYTIESGEQA